MSQQELLLFAIKDLKIQKFLPPFFASTQDEALRLMREQVNYKASLISSFPEDYELYFLGSFSDFTAEIDSDNPTVVCNLASLKSEDTIKYDELLHQTKNLQAQIEASVMRFNSAMNDFKSSFDVFMKDCQKKFDEVIENNSQTEKKNLITELFSK